MSEIQKMDANGNTTDAVVEVNDKKKLKRMFSWTADDGPP